MFTPGSLGSAFSGKRVFLTGHTGFKGSWLAAWLVELGADVTGFSLPSTGETLLYDQLGLAKRLVDLRGDIGDLPALQKAVDDSRPDFIFHLAAQAIVRVSYRQPLETYATNVMGTAHLLEACRRLKSPCTVVCVTTDKCYLNREWLHAYREDDALGGHDPYSASKAAAEIVIASYRDSFFPKGSAVRIASARAGNVIGGGDWAEDRIVPDCMRALERKETIPVRNPTSTRPWQHVLEPLSGYLILAAALSANPADATLAGAFNFGPGTASNRTVLDLVKEILKHWPGECRDTSDPSAVHEAGKLNLATDKAFHLLGWRPSWTFAETVERTVQWYRRGSKGAGAWDLCADQIRSYVQAGRA